MLANNKHHTEPAHEMPLCTRRDACRPSWHVPLANFTANLQQAVSMLHEAGISNVLLMTPPPVGVRHPTNPVCVHCLTLWCLPSSESAAGRSISGSRLKQPKPI